jgi:hypothetical protein
VTVQAFYFAHVDDGRAPLRKSRFEPPSWIVRASFRGRATYWLCHREHFEIELLDPLADVSTLRAAHTRSKEWHRAVQRSVHHPMPMSA